MVNDFNDLDLETTTSVDVDEDILAQKIEFDKIFLNCYNTPEGKRMIETLTDRHVNTPIYLKGDTLEATSYRQGMSDLVTQIYQAVDDAINPPSTGR